MLILILSLAVLVLVQAEFLVAPQVKTGDDQSGINITASLTIGALINAASGDNVKCCVFLQSDVIGFVPNVTVINLCLGVAGNGVPASQGTSPAATKVTTPNSQVQLKFTNLTPLTPYAIYCAETAVIGNSQPNVSSSGFYTTAGLSKNPYEITEFKTLSGTMVSFAINKADFIVCIATLIPFSSAPTVDQIFNGPDGGTKQFKQPLEEASFRFTKLLPSTSYAVFCASQIYQLVSSPLVITTGGVGVFPVVSARYAYGAEVTFGLSTSELVRCAADLLTATTPSRTATEVFDNSPATNSAPFLEISDAVLSKPYEASTIIFEQLAPRQVYRILCATRTSALWSAANPPPNATTAGFVDSPILLGTSQTGGYSVKAKLNSAGAGGNIRCCVYPRGYLKPESKTVFQCDNAFAAGPLHSYVLGDTYYTSTFTGLDAGMDFTTYCASGSLSIIGDVTNALDSTTARWISQPLQEFPQSGSPSSNTAYVSVTLSAAEQIRCVAVEKGDLPTASQVFRGRTQTDTPALAMSPVTVLTPFKEAILSITSLQPSSQLDGYCATESLALSNVFSLGTVQLQFIQQPIRFSDPTNTGFVIETTIDTTDSLRCVVVNPNESPTATQIMNGQSGLNTPAQSAPPATQATYRKAVRVTFTLLSKGRPYKTICATASGVVSAPLTFVTSGGLPVPVLLSTPPAAPSFDISITPPSDSVLRCIATLPGLIEPTAYDVIRGYSDSNTLAPVVTDPVNAIQGQTYTFEMTPVAQNTLYRVFCALATGSRSAALTVAVGNGPDCRSKTSCRDCRFSGCSWSQDNLNIGTKGSCQSVCNATFCAPGNLVCELADCKYNFWSAYSPCSDPCSGGISIRTSTLLDASGTLQNCAPVRTEKRLCNTSPCSTPTIDKISDQTFTAITGYTLPRNYSYTRSASSYAVQKQLQLTGITNGGDLGQAIYVYASTDNPLIARSPYVQYRPNSSFATLLYDIPEKAVGTARIVVTVIDSGSRNSGPMFQSTTFSLTLTDAPIDCVAKYSEWSSCSKSCGGGVRSRREVITVAAQYGGKDCPLPLGYMEQSCNTQDCQALCTWRWSAWSECNPQCGQGTMRRYKIITSPPFTCLDMDTGIDVMACSKPCPVNCVYDIGEWSGCSATCGGGTQRRDVRIINQSAYGGLKCPLPLPQISRTCNAVECKLIGPSCKNYCGSSPPDASCHCDKQCIVFGDCCRDYSELCNSRASSCASRCGDYTPGLCACDDKCENNKDCCEDKAAICKKSPLKTPPLGCAGNCGGQAPNGCWCDLGCQQTGDCCADYVQTCQAANANSCAGRCVLISSVGVAVSASLPKPSAPSPTSKPYVPAPPKQNYDPYASYSQYRVADSTSDTGGFGLTIADVSATSGFGLSKADMLNMVGTKQFVPSQAFTAVTRKPAAKPDPVPLPVLPTNAANAASASRGVGCKCSSDCQVFGDCCSDYLIVCKV